MSCLEFGKHDEGQECPAELEPVSEYSPGIVLNEEYLARLIFTPIHVDDETGEVNAAAFSDVKDKRLSVNRIQHISRPDLAQKGCTKAETDKAAGKEREFVGVIESACLDIRSIKVERNQSFCVVDTALENDTSHADVCQIKLGRKAGRLARTALMKAFTDKPVAPDNYN